MSTAIVGVGRAAYTRHPAGDVTTLGLLAKAARSAVADAGLRWSDVDGLAVASMSLLPDHAIDVAWHMGLSLRWIEDCSVGGASGVHMLDAAVTAIETGRANAVVVVAGDHFSKESFAGHASSFNSATRDHLAPLEFGGTNALFAMITSRQMTEFGLERSDYGRLVVAQRLWASRNPDAVYRNAMTLDDYLRARPVAPPLTIFDCPPVVSGAEAFVVVAEADTTDRHVRVLGASLSYNTDNQSGTGLNTGHAAAAGELASATGVSAADCDVLSLYDDYPAVVLAQLVELNLVPDDDLAAFCRTRFADNGFALNTSGGQLSAGQAGVGGSLLGVTEVVTQLRGRAGARQIEGARLGLVTGYGMVLYRYGAACGLALLEAA